MKNIYEQVSSNQIKSFVVVSFFFAFIAFAVYTIGLSMNLDSSFLYIAFLFSSVTTVGSYFFSDKIVLSMSGAKPADPKHEKILFQVTENLSTVARIPMPKLYVIEDSGLNAFATGRDPKHAAVAVTRGLLEALNRTQLEGVVAHELAHVKNYDTLLMTVVAVMVGFLAILVDWVQRMLWFGGNRNNDDDRKSTPILAIIGLVMIILSPLIANLIKLAISRRREFYADAWAAKLTRYPDGLIQALQIISQNPKVSSSHNATAHLYIQNPVKNLGKNMTNLFSTHPPVEQRIMALKGML